MPEEALTTVPTYDLFDNNVQKNLNTEPLTEQAAVELANKLHENNPAQSLTIRSRRFIISE